MLCSGNVEKVKTIYGEFLSWKNDLITNQLIQFSAHTRNELAMLRSLIKEGDNIIDLGAHIGTYSIPFTVFNKKKGKVFSFEADKENYRLLELNILNNYLDDVIVCANAIVSESEQTFIKFEPNDKNTGMHCFLPNNYPSEVAIEDTNAINIDNWYEGNEKGVKIDFIKIDIEGAEMSAIRSCKNIIQDYLPILYIEINKEALDRFNTTYDDIEETLRFYGYRFFRNSGPRNSDNDLFNIIPLGKVSDGGVFFDLLAVHPNSSRFTNLPRLDLKEGLL